MIGSRFDGCIFLNVNFDEAQFLECDFTERDFVNCQLYGASFSDTDLSGGTFGGCDMRFAEFTEVVLADTSFDDADLSDANIESVFGLDGVQLTVANGNTRTLLPVGVERPADWYIEETDQETVAGENGVPGQLAAPLRVTWRRDKLVPAVRHDEEDWRNSSITVIFNSLKEDVDAFLEQSATNHPVSRHIKGLAVALRSGLSGLNSVAVGYHVELMKQHLPTLEEELSASTAGAVRAIAMGGELLASQFSDWQEIAANRDAVRTDHGLLAEASNSLQSIAASMRKMPELFDRRVSEIVEEQAADLTSPAENARVQTGVARSSGNVASGLATQFLSITKAGAKTAGEETVKQLIAFFFKQNIQHIQALVEWAPSTLSWVTEFFRRHLP
jgi:hypothetical protein